MQFKAAGKDAENQEFIALRGELEKLLSALKFNLIDLVVSKHRGSVQVRVVIYNGNSIGTDDCSRVHRAISPRLEIIFDQQDVYLEVSSTGIDRLIKDGAEFRFYLGKTVRCYRTDISDWTTGILESADEEGITLRIKAGENPTECNSTDCNSTECNSDEAVRLEYNIIAKAKLDSGN